MDSISIDLNMIFSMYDHSPEPSAPADNCNSVIWLAGADSIHTLCQMPLQGL